MAGRRFFPNLEWYVDTMITLIERAGEFATKDVWHSTVQLVLVATPPLVCLLSKTYAGLPNELCGCGIIAPKKRCHARTALPVA